MTTQSQMLHLVQLFEGCSGLQIKANFYFYNAFSSPNPIFDHLLESSHWDDSNKWSNIGFGEEKGIVEIEICFYLEP